jgi:hypothetical protein
MRRSGTCWRRSGPLIAALLLLAGCAHHHAVADADSDGVNAYPANYKSDILAAMHAYLNDPTGVRDAGLTPPALKQIGGVTHFVACVRFSAKTHDKVYAPPKEIAAVFIAGRFDHFVESAAEQCTGITYAPFPELGQLAP